MKVKIPSPAVVAYIFHLSKRYWEISNNLSTDVKLTPQAEKPHNTPKTPALVCGSASSDCPYNCPYEGCDKSYIHKYKLNLHLKRKHPGHNSEENGKHNVNAENEVDEGSDPDAYNALKSGNGNSTK
ncbi:hypothetical protein AMTRI_Chr11g154170 [Amborella trichopoda]|uniref:C2H2-type domain-containing protein n=1 Tax=Amborella trichopoda TaxID=13333 RepID=W1NQ41_AMBTC|nr:uncharacterized zinc finger protein At4g06634-like [Amborella trichopoda]ERM97852.1 hypothetical protein AMTR_s00118p00133040 [Amborella trichopoda]|eukprot:XP_020517871.1 uncharacterized zinc finger protein At4g06634-like [Amborella trichopoda]